MSYFKFRHVMLITYFMGNNSLNVGMSGYNLIG